MTTADAALCFTADGWQLQAPPQLEQHIGGIQMERRRDCGLEDAEGNQPMTTTGIDRPKAASSRPSAVSRSRCGDRRRALRPPSPVAS